MLFNVANCCNVTIIVQSPNCQEMTKRTNSYFILMKKTTIEAFWARWSQECGGLNGDRLAGERWRWAEIVSRGWSASGRDEEREERVYGKRRRWAEKGGGGRRVERRKMGKGGRDGRGGRCRWSKLGARVSL